MSPFPNLELTPKITTLTLTSPAYALSLGPLKRFRYLLHLGPHIADESILISHSNNNNNNKNEGKVGGRVNDHSNCYEINGQSGTVTIVLHSLVHISAIQIYHHIYKHDRMDNTDNNVHNPKSKPNPNANSNANSNANPNANLNTNPDIDGSALKRFRVIGWPSDPSNPNPNPSGNALEGIDVGTFEFKIPMSDDGHSNDNNENNTDNDDNESNDNSDNIENDENKDSNIGSKLQNFLPQYQPESNPSIPSIKAITIQVLSNHGASHTSLCRVKVLGVLSNQISEQSAA